MSDQPTIRRVWGLFAELLEYPHHSPLTMLGECRDLTETLSPDAAAKLAVFRVFAEGATIGKLQEEYTRAFDMDETHSLYVGYHLLGESYKRSALLLELKQLYRTQGMEVSGELADHLPVVLRFLAVCKDHEISKEILEEAVWPVLDMMAKKDEKSETAAKEEEDHPPVAPRPYHDLLAALLEVVELVATRDQQPLVIIGAEGPAT